MDSVLRRAVDAVEVPGVVAMAATDKGLPFADPRALQVYGQFERGVYDALNGAWSTAGTRADRGRVPAGRRRVLDGR